MENTVTISVAEYTELIKAKYELEQVKRIAGDRATPSWKKDEMISFVLDVKEETNAE